MRVLLIGGTRFIGRHAVEAFRDAGHEVTIFHRGEHPSPHDVAELTGNRENESALELARERADPDAVVDLVAYHPKDVRAATEIFADARYVYVSSGAAYAAEEIPKREGETALHDCTPEQARDDSMATYGARKAEGDRAVFAAAERGVAAMSVRPCVVYGPHDYTGRLDYWLDRVRRFDRVVVPGDGTNLWHRAYVEDVADALRVVAESGTPGEAYNVGDRRLATLDDLVEHAADAFDQAVETVHASDRELGIADLSAGDFPLYRDYPHALDTSKLAALGWSSTPLDAAMERTAREHAESDRTGRENGPDREAEQRVIEVLGTV